MSEWGIPYDGDGLPVTAEWIEENGGNYVGFYLEFDLDELIEMGGIDNFMDVAEVKVGVLMTDPTWKLVKADDMLITIRYVGCINEEL